MSLTEENIDFSFELATKSLKELSDLQLAVHKNDGEIFPTISTKTKLQSYAYYKQATKGAYKGITYGFSEDSIKDLKLKEWYHLGQMSSEEAKRHYCQLTVSILLPYTKIDIKKQSDYLGRLSVRLRDRFAIWVFPPTINSYFYFYLGFGIF